MPLPDPPPHPRQLMQMLDAGHLTLDDFRAAMAVHARAVIEEMEEDHRNPLAAWFDQIMNRRAANKLVRRHGESLIREVFLALSDAADFPPARLLWNAHHPHIPLHCFLRTQRPPVFRILSIEAFPQVVNLTIEFGAPKEAAVSRETVKLRRDRHGQLFLERRQASVPG